MRIKTGKKAQSVLEYTMVIIIIAAALTAMSTYLLRSVNARLHQVEDELEYHGSE